MNALVTGASSGIGKEIALLLGQRGYHLVLVARREEALRSLSEELPYGATVLPMDLSETGAAKRLFSQCQKLGLEIEVLVNNAGFGKLSHHLDVEVEQLEEMNSLNMACLSSLCRLFADPMRERGQGAILNVGSVAAYMPIPGMGNYAATKAFVASLTWALHHELSQHGVLVSLLNPGPTATEFGQRAKPDGDFFKGKPGVISARDVAEAGLQGLFSGQPEVITGSLNQAVPLLMRLLPKTLVVKIAAKWAGR